MDSRKRKGFLDNVDLPPKDGGLFSGRSSPALWWATQDPSYRATKGPPSTGTAP